MARYEAETRDIIPTAIVTKGAKPQRHVILNASRREDYETLIAELQSVLLAQVGVAAMGAASSAAGASIASPWPTPMDVDSLVAVVLGRTNDGKKCKGKGAKGGKDCKGGKKTDSKAAGAGKGDQTASDGKKSFRERVCFKYGKLGQWRAERGHRGRRGERRRPHLPRVLHQRGKLAAAVP